MVAICALANSCASLICAQATLHVSEYYDPPTPCQLTTDRDVEINHSARGVPIVSGKVEKVEKVEIPGVFRPDSLTKS